MAWFEDQSPCDYFGVNCGGTLRAVGWLEAGRPFSTGRVDREVYSRLLELLKDRWQPGVFMEHHDCDLCLYDGEAGVRNLFVPADGAIFVCPEMIAHYMNAHGYRPPDEFCRAVLECPPMRSMPYLKAIAASGAGPLLRRGPSRTSPAEPLP